MAFLHHQTYLPPGQDPNPPLKTNWGGINNANTTRTTSVSSSTYGVVTPRVGSYLWWQFNGGYVQYNNTIPSTWNSFTIEGWVTLFRDTIQPTLQNSVTTLTIGAGNSYWDLQIIPNPATNQWQVGYLSWRYPGGSTPIVTTGSGFISTNTWAYFTLVKQSDGTVFFMLNGTLRGSVANPGSISDPDTTSGVALAVGGGTSTAAQVAWDMIRISNVARYQSTDTFTPPTTAFANDVNTWFLTDAENTYTPSPSPT